MVNYDPREYSDEPNDVTTNPSDGSRQPRRFPLSSSRPSTAARPQTGNSPDFPVPGSTGRSDRSNPFRDPHDGQDSPSQGVASKLRRSFSVGRSNTEEPTPTDFHRQRRRSSRMSIGAAQGDDLGAISEDPNQRMNDYKLEVERKKKQSKSPWVKMQEGFDNAYQKIIIETILRQRPLSPSKDGRHIPLEAGRARAHHLIDERRGGQYISNFIRSSRYSLWSFLPKQIYFQFSKLANFYFLVIGILQLIPGFSTTGTWTTMGPLLFFVSLSIAKEGYDDYKRYEMDKSENRSGAWILDPGRTVTRKVVSQSKEAIKGAARKAAGRKQRARAAEEMEMQEIGNRSRDDDGQWAIVEWQDVRVGDIIRLKRDQQVPADFILLHATGPNGIAYIETMALDGETNLKSKQACPLLAKRCSTVSDLIRCRAIVVSEDPNLDLYHYEGRAILDDEAMPLTINEVVYRGSTLRNTREAWGLVINSGEECKIRMNAHKNVTTKAPKMQAWLNRIVLFLVCVLLVITAGCTGGYYLWRDYENKAFYLQNAQVPFQEIWFGFLIMFNTLIPLSLYVSLEIIKIGQFLLMNDIEMYDEETDTPFGINTTTILENLGQVSYVFSDKTGTLTENKMRFRKLTIAGSAWYHDRDVQEEEAERQAYGDIKNPQSTSEELSSSVPQAEPNSMAMLKYIQAHPDTAFSKKARFFLVALAVCHTALPEKSSDGEISFQAASPDELALVQAARDFGYLLIDRPTQSIKLQRQDARGQTYIESYEVLDVIEFSSDRKRMSIIVRMPDGEICIFCKGADSAVLPRLRSSQAAMQKVAEVERRASKRRSADADRAIERQRTSLSGRISMSEQRPGMFARRSTDLHRQSMLRESVDENRPTIYTGVDAHGNESTTFSPISATGRTDIDWNNPHVDEAIASNDSAIFDRCFTHLDRFASEGLRTLIYAHRFLSAGEYEKWKQIYLEATTSLVDRQKLIDEAGEMIEQKFELTGATAIEDRLQEGVPETIDKLRRANIKVWMLTGDKRETAINIANSARICKPFSDLYIIDVTTDNLHDRITSILFDITRRSHAHTVVVVDGQTLKVVEEDESLKIMFFDLVVRLDSVVCCRASPSQKANLVNCIRNTVPGSLTLAIGDGGNDIAMIQASHVGVGISGKEGLQAARVADYSIAQFRFLQRLLFVHGRWVYHRTGKYILATFWKEIVFYMVQAQYQRFTGYTGTSLYEAWSLTLFNVIFTSLPVIFLGVFEIDLQPETLLAIPELYSYGQQNKAFNLKKYLTWMAIGLADTAIIYWMVYGNWIQALFTEDNGLFAFGQLAYTVAMIAINTKCLILELHSKNIITFLGFLWAPFSWFIYQFILAAIFKGWPEIPYFVRSGFAHEFGTKLSWWTNVLGALLLVVAFELGITALKRIYFPSDTDLWQEIEQQGTLKDVLHEYDVENGNVHNNKADPNVDGSGKSVHQEPASPRSFG